MSAGAPRDRPARRGPGRAGHGLAFLITAGPTREYLDPVRYLSNDSSGRMGMALADAARRRGHHVTLVHGPLSVPVPPATRGGSPGRPGLRTVAVLSAEQMRRACLKLWPRHDVLIMAAAVADYAPLRPRRHKMRRGRSLRHLTLRPTPDILAELARQRRPGQVAIGFALEDRRPRRSAEGKLRRKGLDAIVLNRPSAIGSGESTVELLTCDRGWVRLGRGSKQRCARRLIREAERLALQARLRIRRGRARGATGSLH